MKMLKLLLLAVVLFSSCAGDNLAQTTVTETAPKLILTPKLRKNADGLIELPTLYWSTPRTLPAFDWYAVFGGTVINVKKESVKMSGDFSREYVSGALKIEKVFLNLPGSSEISINSVVTSENFDDLKKGDKVIIFINGFYEREFVRVEVEGTSSKLGFKVKDWNEPIVSVLEKIAPCNKTQEEWPEGHPRETRILMYNCGGDWDKFILDDPEISKVWKRYDPKGFEHLVEMRKLDSAEK